MQSNEKNRRIAAIAFRMAFAVLLFFFWVVRFSYSAVVSHPASQVSPGTFQTGDYSFDGKVGIGVSSSGYRFDVRGSVSLNDTLFVTETGMVGIGTAAPQGKLHIIGPNAGYVFTSNSTSSYTTTFNMNNTGLYVGHNSAIRSLNLVTGGTDRMTITGAGNVGIGTASPGARLEVSGIIRTTPMSSATCNPSTEGGIYYDSDDNHFYGCNGAEWVKLDTTYS